MDCNYLERQRRRCAGAVQVVGVREERSSGGGETPSHVLSAMAVDSAGLAKTRNATLDQSRVILLMQLRSTSGRDCYFGFRICSGVWVAGLTGTYAGYTVLQDLNFRSMPDTYRGNS